MNGLDKDDIIRSYLNLHPDTPIDWQEYSIPLRVVKQMMAMVWTKKHWTDYEHNIVAAERERICKLLDEMDEQDKFSNYYGVAARKIREQS